jgi:thiamine-phosphate diphosphorylase
MLNKNGLIYLILDTDFISGSNKDIYKIASIAAKNGVDLLQYRFKNIPINTALKQAEKISQIVAKTNKKTKLIINDRVDIAKASGSQGVHLGEEDISPFAARKVLGKKYLIGKTVHNKKELTKTLAEPVDYISIGPAFRTEAKPYLKPLGLKKIKKLMQNINKPVFVIGGIRLQNIIQVKEQGFNKIALTRGILKERNINYSINQIKKILKK